MGQTIRLRGRFQSDDPEIQKLLDAAEAQVVLRQRPRLASVHRIDLLMEVRGNAAWQELEQRSKMP